MFKFNPIKQAIFEGFFQRIVSIENNDTLSPLFMQLPMYFITDAKDTRRLMCDGWDSVFSVGFPQQRRYEFYADREGTTAKRGYIERLATDEGDYDDDVVIEMTLDPVAGDSTQWYSVAFHDLDVGIWIEYLPALIDDGNGNEIEAPITIVPEIIGVSNYRVEADTFGENTKKLTIYLSSFRPSILDRNKPYMRGIRIHYATQAPYIHGYRNHAGVSTAYYSRVDTAPFETVLSPSGDLATKGIPKLEFDCLHGAVIRERVVADLDFKVNYRGQAALAMYKFPDADSADSVGVWAGIHRDVDPNNYKYMTVNQSNPNGSHTGRLLSFNSQDFDVDDTSLTIEKENLTPALGIINGFPEQRNIKDANGHIDATGDVWNRGGFGFGQLPPDEEAAAYQVPHEVIVSNRNFSRFFERYVLSNSLRPRQSSLSVSVDDSAFKASYSVNGIKFIDINLPNVDTAGELKVMTRNRYAESFGTRGGAVIGEYEGIHLATLKPAGKVLNTNFDISTYPYGGTGYSYAWLGYIYKSEQRSSEPRPPNPTFYSFEGIYNPSITQY